MSHQIPGGWPSTAYEFFGDFTAPEVSISLPSTGSTTVSDLTSDTHFSVEEQLLEAVSTGLGFKSEDSARDIDVPRLPGLDPVAENDVLCDNCDLKGPDRWHCNVCRVHFCPKCWDSFLLHRKNIGPAQVVHERTNVTLLRKIHQSLRPGRTDDVESELHESDLATTWFGVVRESGNDAEPKFLDHGRFEELMTEYPLEVRPRLFPSIVSFIGQTGAGKSSLINLLITLGHLKGDQIQMPVVGSVLGENQPTSGDVHLYKDPRSATVVDGHATPILYADCEGLQGGDADPRSYTFTKQSKARQVLAMATEKAKDLLWPDSSCKKTRQYIVTNLYSRLLYTFSDVIVLVLENSRTIENVTEMLLGWAANSIEQSTNQPALPHAIIVLNKTDNNHPDSYWDPKTANQWLFAGMDESLHNTAKFRKYLEKWESIKGKKLYTLELLQCYYTTIQVIRVPKLSDGEGRPNKIYDQMSRLYNQIVEDCKEVQEKKAKIRMLLNADQFNTYLQLAIEHFRSPSGLQKPFDFVQASFSNFPISSKFSDHIVFVAKMFKTLKPNHSFKDIFNELTPLISSCIMFDAAKNDRLGDAAAILPNYSSFYKDALQTFIESSACFFPGCINTSQGHASGHQGVDGKILGNQHIGLASVSDQLFISCNSFQRYQLTSTEETHFINNLKSCLAEFLNLPNHSMNGGKENALNLHRHNIRDFYGKHGGPSGAATFAYKTSCLVCLMGIANRPLPCGHVICVSCLECYGSRSEATSVSISECPLHESNSWSHPYTTRLVPIGAGIRALALDGGGIQGISQLVVLECLGHLLGGKIKVQSFFDMIVGTSTGGIIAAGLALNSWSVPECSRQFESLCSKAFKWRFKYEMTPMWLFQSLFERFDSDGLEKALKAAFGEDRYLFGAHESQRDVDIKLALTSCSKAGGIYVLGNYNRMSNAATTYNFIRGQERERELKIWEAARATSATPTWFTGYKANGTTYLDGGLHNKNPINILDHERKLVWPDCQADVTVSIGTSYNPALEVKKSTSKDQSIITRSATYVLGLLGLARNYVQDSLDSELTWREYHQRLKTRGEACLRLNTILKEPVKDFYDAKTVEHLVDHGQEFWNQPENHEILDDLAQKLIASSFYFKHNSGPIAIDKKGFAVFGEILCRFPVNSDQNEIQHLAEYFQSRWTGIEKYPCFRILEQGTVDQNSWPISSSVLELMISDNKFILTAEPIKFSLSSHSSMVEMSLCFDDQTSQPISGCPRRFTAS